MGKRSGPKPPDPVQLAQQQAAANRQAAETNLKLNALDRTGPFGSATFDRDASGTPTGQTVSLTAPLQDTVDQTSLAASNLASFLPQDRFKLADVPQGQDLSTNFFNQQKELLQPGFDDQLRNFEIRAAERGLPLGSEAFDNSLSPVLRAQNQALNQAAFNAVQLTPQEEQRQIKNTLLERQLPFQETSDALKVLGQVPVPSFAPQPQAGVAATDVVGIHQQNFKNQADLAAQKNAALGSLLGTAGTIGGAILGGPIGAQLGNRMFGGIPTGGGGAGGSA